MARSEADKHKKVRFRLYGGWWGKTIVLLLRLAVGGVFIFAGFTKVVDPWGSIYKFEEYFAIFGLTGYDGMLVFLAFTLAILETMLGVAVFLGIYRRSAPLVMMLMMAVMLPLTLYIAVTGALRHCGCFGDALTLGNWETFWKNVALTAGIIYLLAYNKKVMNVYSFAVQWIVVLLTVPYLILIANHGYGDQPLIDFRPYPVGSVYCDAVDAGSGDDAFTFLYEKDGTVAEFSIDSLPDETWQYVDRVATGSPDDGVKEWHLSLLDKNHRPADDAIRTEGEQLMLVFNDLSSVWVSQTYFINDIYDYAAARDVSVIGLTSATEAEIEEWNDLSMAFYELYLADGDELKALVRGNPALVYLKDGEIKWKRSLQSITFEDISQAGTIDRVGDNTNARRRFMWLTAAYLAAMFLLLIANRTYSLWIWRIRKRKAKLLKKLGS